MHVHRGGKSARQRLLDQAKGAAPIGSCGFKDHQRAQKIHCLVCGLRIPFQAIVAQIYAGLQARGYTDLRPAHFVVFQFLPPEGAHLTELAEATQTTKQSMGDLVAHLEAQGDVALRPDPTDRRAKQVTLTARGQELDAAVREIVNQIEKDLAEQLGNNRMAELKQTLCDFIAMISRA
jgi:MarR family transcriptional regulator, temperature-dependent positive regulator of motility